MSAELLVRKAEILREEAEMHIVGGCSTETLAATVEALAELVESLARAVKELAK